MRSSELIYQLSLSSILILMSIKNYVFCIECYQCNSYSPSNTPQESADCAAGVNITDKIVNCEEEGWGSSCIARILKYDSTGNEIWLRSCVSPPPMTCDPGLDDSGAAGPVWTQCCEG